MAALKLVRFSKKLDRLSSAGREIITFGSHCSTNFQPIWECFLPSFKMKYRDSENIKADHVKTVVFNFIHQIKHIDFFGTPVTMESI